MQSIDIYRDGALLVTVKPNKNSTQNKTIMGENVLQLDFELSAYVGFKINDYCEVFGEVYKILELPSVTKKGQYTYEYTVKMNAEGADLSKFQFLFLDNSNQLTEPDFSLMGNAKTFLDLVLQNANRADSGWELGEVIDTVYKNLTFSKENCLSALARIAEAFETEYWLVGKTIHLTKKVRDAGITFKHGKRKGLYEIQRLPLSGGIITRLYAFGSNKNLPSSYGHQRLRLPGNYDPCLISNLTIKTKDNGDGTQVFSFHFTPATGAGIQAITIQYRIAGSGAAFSNNTGANQSPRFLTLPAGSYEFRFQTEGGACAGSQTSVVAGPTATTQFLHEPTPYLENNVSKYGLIEYTQYFEDIYPKRTGKVTGVNSADVYKFIDTTIDFDIKDYLLPGTAAKVTFNTGQLAGYTFDIKSYDHNTKEVTILKNKDEKSIDVPSAALHPAIGDEYVFVDIQLPQSYVVAAENKLLAEATKFLLINSSPRYSYNVTIDPVFIDTYNHSIQLGDEVWLTDAQLEVNRKIRVVNVIRNIVNENEYQVQLSDSVSQGTITQITNNLQSAQQGLSNLSGQLQNNAIFNGRVIGNLKFEQGTAVFDAIPETATTTGFLPVYLNAATGELYVKV